MDICIIGGGMMGLATAYFLSKSDNNIVVMEKEKEVGGLSRSAEICPGLHWDRYYHVILSTDTDLLRFIDDIGLSLDVQFRTTKTGFFTDGRLHSMSNIFEFITFKPLSLTSKFRLGLGILFASRIHKGTRLEKVYAKSWLIRIFGRRNYEKLWDPLLRSKLGSASPKASGAFIWAIIKRYYGTRQKGSKQESMGCVRGGYHSIFKKIQEILKEKRVAILLDHAAQKIVPQPDGRIGVIDYRGETRLFDKVIATLPNPNLIALLPDDSNNLKTQLRRIDYLSLVCVVLALKRSLCPYYVTNITDPDFPFTGVIEATNVVPKEILGDHALVYLPRWMPRDDPFIHQPDEAILEQFYAGLRRIFPDFKEKQITAARVHREFNVQPIQTLDYQRSVPPMETEISGLYLVNTSMILNSTLNNNQVIGLARKMAAKLLKDQ